MSFPGFAAKDFDAYQQHKWASNAFNLERLQVKQKLGALGKELEASVVAADGSLLALELSVEHPAVWNQRRVENQCLFFSRHEAARRELDGIISRRRTIASLIEDPSPLRNHIVLAIEIDATGVNVALKLHSDAAVDRDNLQRKTQDFFHRERLLALIRALPGPFAVGLESRDMHRAAAVDDESLQAMIRELPSADTWLSAQRQFPVDAPEICSPAFVDTARSLLRDALLPLLHHVAWSRDNDFLSMSDTLRQEAVRHRSKGLSKNDRVRVLQGMFAGKTGVVQAVDGKGGLKVQLGTMTVKLSGGDVVKL